MIPSQLQGESPSPDGGSHGRRRAKSRIRVSASQKLGTETPSSASGDRHVVDPGAAVDGRNHPERDPEHRRDRQGGEAEPERVGQTALEVVQDRRPLAQRFAEIEPGQLLEVSKVLDIDRIVEAVLLVDAFQHFRALGRRQVRPDEERAGVAGRSLHREEDQRDRAEDRWHREEQALDDVLLHGLHLVQRRGRKWFRPEGAAMPACNGDGATR